MNLRKLINIFEAAPVAPVKTGTGASGFPIAGAAAKPAAPVAAKPAAKPAAKLPVGGAAKPAARPGTAAAGVAFNQGAAPSSPPSAGNEALKGQVIGAGAPSTTTPAAPSGAAAAMASKSAAPGRDPGLVNALGIQGQATNVAGADALTGGAAKPAPAAPSTQGSAAGFAPAAPTAAPAPSTQGSAAGFAPAAPAGGAAKPGGFSATGMAGTDFEESIEEELEEEINDDLREMMRLSGLPLNEKAVSKQQQKFMGMVHAMQKGEKVKGASKELKAAAKGMSKKDAKDFARTKHKGLPKKVTEGVVLEAGSTLEHIVNKFKYETKKFINGEDLDSDLYEALFDYYSDNGEIPYGVAKARDGDPITWIENRFEDELNSMGYPRTHSELNYRGDQDLTELARLAGLTNEGSLSDTIKSGATTVRRAIDKATLPAGMHAEYDRIEAEKDKRATSKANDLLGAATGSKSADAADKVDLPSLNRLKEDELNECGDMDMEQPDSFNVSTNMSSDGTKSVNISAQGNKADELLQMLKMAGMRPHDDHGHSGMQEPEVIMIGSDEEMMDEDRETEYVNTPDEEYQTVDSILRQGNDLNREKEQHPVAGFTGDNPMAESILDADLDAMLESILLRDDKNVPNVKKDPTTGRVSATYPAPKKPDQSTLPLQTEPYHGPRDLKVDSERTGTEGRGKDNETEMYEEEPTWLQKQPSKSQEEIAKDWDARVKADKDYVIPAERPYKDEKTGRMITPPKGATNPPPDSQFPPGDKRNMMPPKRK